MGATCCDARSHITPGIDEMLKKDKIPSNESERNSDSNMPAVEILVESRQKPITPLEPSRQGTPKLILPTTDSQAVDVEIP